mgnify:CR=1 FL=1
MAKSVPNRNKNRSIEIGDTVHYGHGLGTGKVTHIRGVESDPEGTKGGYSLTIAQKNEIIQNVIRPMSVVTVEPVILAASISANSSNVAVLYESMKL